MSHLDPFGPILSPFTSIRDDILSLVNQGLFPSSDLIGRIISLFLIFTIELRREKGNIIMAFIFGTIVLFFGNIGLCLYFICLLGEKDIASPQSETTIVSKKSSSPPFFEIPANMDTFWVAFFTITAVYTRCTDLSHPHHVLFDETHFGGFVNNHIKEIWYYDIHPPWVKLVIAWFLVNFTGYDGNQLFSEIGDKFLPTSPVKAFRFIPSLAAALIVPVTYLTARQLKISRWGSLLSATMMLLDNLVIAEGRMLTTDTSLLFFISTTFYTYVCSSNKRLHSFQWYLWTSLCGLSMGMMISTKWTSLSVVGIIGISTVHDLLYRRHVVLFPFNKFHFNVKDFFVRLFLLLGIPVLFYLLMFKLWFLTCTHKGEFGHMTKAFLTNLKGATPSGLPMPSFLSNFYNLNKSMFVGNKNILTPHHWQSYWYTWPLDLRGLNCWYSAYYTNASGQSVQQHVYFLGNPFVWWSALLFLIIGPFVYSLSKSNITEKSLTSNDSVDPSPSAISSSSTTRLFLLYVGYVTSILPYVLIQRSCFIYHYLPPLFFGMIASGVICDHLIFLKSVSWRWKFYPLLSLLLAWSWSFWFFGVFTYGVPITVHQFESRIWVDPGWR